MTLTHTYIYPPIFWELGVWQRRISWRRWPLQNWPWTESQRMGHSASIGLGVGPHPWQWVYLVGLSTRNFQVFPHEFFGSAIKWLGLWGVWPGLFGSTGARLHLCGLHLRVQIVACLEEHTFFGLGKRIEKDSLHLRQFIWSRFADISWVAVLSNKFRCPVRLYLQQTGDGLHLFDVAHLCVCWPPRLKIPVLDLAPTLESLESWFLTFKHISTYFCDVGSHHKWFALW
jgi:hypothetical protein